MTPTLLGRIETRWFLLATVGLGWTIIFTPFLTVVAGGAAIGDLYKATLLNLVVVAVLGTGWECLWHFLMQFRWEKDWPAIFILGEAVPEAFLAFFVLQQFVGFNLPVFAYIVIYATTWLWVFLAAHTVMRIPFVRWRYRGGRLV